MTESSPESEQVLADTGPLKASRCLSGEAANSAIKDFRKGGTFHVKSSRKFLLTLQDSGKLGA